MATKKQTAARREVAALISAGETGWLEWMVSNRVWLTPILAKKNGRQVVEYWFAGYRQLDGDGWSNFTRVFAKGMSPIEALMKLSQIPRPRG